MREPLASLRFVCPKSLQPPVGIGRDAARAPALVVEDEHPNRPRLSIANGREHRPRDAVDSLAQRSRDRVQLSGRARAEEGDRDVQVLLGNHACAGERSELLHLPAGDIPGDEVGQAKAEEEPKALMPLDATGGGHAEW